MISIYQIYREYIVFIFFINNGYSFKLLLFEFHS